MRNVLAAGAVFVMITLSGCVPEESPPETVTETASSSTTETPTPSTTESPTASEDQFYRLMRQNTAVRGTDEELKELGQSVCESFDAGHSVDSVAWVLVDSGFSSFDSGFTIGASVGTFCPEHMNKIDDYTEGNVENG